MYRFNFLLLTRALQASSFARNKRLEGFAVRLPGLLREGQEWERERASFTRCRGSVPPFATTRRRLRLERTGENKRGGGILPNPPATGKDPRTRCAAQGARPLSTRRFSYATTAAFPSGTQHAHSVDKTARLGWLCPHQEQPRRSRDSFVRSVMVGRVRACPIRRGPDIGGCRSSAGGFEPFKLGGQRRIGFELSSPRKWEQRRRRRRGRQQR